jgi:hypothetical protein
VRGPALRNSAAAAGNRSAGMPPIFMIERCLCVVAAGGFARAVRPRVPIRHSVVADGLNSRVSSRPLFPFCSRSGNRSSVIGSKLGGWRTTACLKALRKGQEASSPPKPGQRSPTDRTGISSGRAPRKVGVGLNTALGARVPRKGAMHRAPQCQSGELSARLLQVPGALVGFSQNSVRDTKQARP